MVPRNMNGLVRGVACDDNKLRLVSVSEPLLTTSFISSINPSNLKEKCPYLIADHILHYKFAAAESAQNCQLQINTSSTCCDIDLFVAPSTTVDCNSPVKQRLLNNK